MAANKQQFSNITVASFHLSESGLTPVGTPSFVDWLACGQFIRSIEQSVQFWIGDWLVYGEEHFGKTDYEQAISKTGLSYQTLRIYKSVARAFPLALRHNSVSFHHHKEIATLPPETQAQLLQQAEEENWPLFKLKQEKYRLRLETARETTPAPTTSGIILKNPAEYLQTLPDHCLDMVITTPSPNLADLHSLEESLALLEQKLKENSHVYLFTDWKAYPHLLPVAQKYLTVKNLLVWQGQPIAIGEGYQHVYELILFANTGERRYLNGRRDANLLPFAMPKKTELFHPTDQPLDLLQYLIKKSSQPDEVVCDPFMGAGAVCLAAKNTGRRYLGIETNREYYETAYSRLA
jgi:DNA methylase